MKASTHLFYGIIIGVLICACTGSNSDSESATQTNTATPTSIKSDKAEFKVEKIEDLGGARNATVRLDKLKQGGWTIIDIDISTTGSSTSFYAHIGR
jgi:hypothetical protein